MAKKLIINNPSPSDKFLKLVEIMNKARKEERGFEDFPNTDWNPGDPVESEGEEHKQKAA